jgi:glycosyltransferase involved in cell wall biosynthesis
MQAQTRAKKNVGAEYILRESHVDKVLVHINHPLPQRRTSGSRVRPYYMCKAFRDIGYEVEIVAGTLWERGRQAYELVRSGRVASFSFCYAEPSTYPLNPFIDYTFYLALKARGIPIGLFYRDAYWKFADWFPYHGSKKRLLLVRYWSDVLFLPKAVSAFFFPSQMMASLFRFSTPKFALPPGGHIFYENEQAQFSPKVERAVYVGGIRQEYGIDLLLDAFDLVNRERKLDLELVCRKDKYVSLRSIFEKYVKAKWLHIHHLWGKSLGPVYHRSDIALIPRRKNAYNDLAMPVKLFEYLSYGLPIIATDCTEMADFVQRNRIGIVVQDNALSLAEGVLRIARDQGLYRELKRNAKQTLENGNLWTDRAERVAECLMALDERC